MTSYRYWRPGDEPAGLRQAMDRLMEDAYVRAPQGQPAAAAAVRRPPFDVYETPHEFVLRAWLPGARPDQLDLTFERGRLTLQAPIAEHQAPERQVMWHHRELSSGRWALSLELSADIDPAQADAALEHGVLTLRLPKAETTRPRSIQVRPAEGNRE